MEMETARAAFAALGQGTRLRVLRLLVQAGPGGLLAGEIAARLEVRQNTLSSNLAVLVQAGLIVGLREGRGIRYRPDIAGIRGLLSFLMDDCCGGRPELCPPSGASAIPAEETEA